VHFIEYDEGDMRKAEKQENKRNQPSKTEQLNCD